MKCQMCDEELVDGLRIPFIKTTKTEPWEALTICRTCAEKLRDFCDNFIKETVPAKVP